MSKQITVMALGSLLLTACGTLPHHKTATPVTAAPVENKAESKPPAVAGSGGYLPGDGPGTDTPVNLDAIPDAIPKREPLHRYANRPYIALGKTYKPMTVAGNFKQRGIASWYGKKFNGEHTSTGEIYDMYAMTAAHPTLPLPSYARVTNLANQKSVIVRVNDRGPFMNDRIIDLSYTAAYKLGIIANGSAEVEVESLAPDVSVNTITANTVRSQPLESSAPPIPPGAPVAVASAVAAVPANGTAVTTTPSIDSPSTPVADTPAPAAAVPVTVPPPVTPPENQEASVYLQLGAFSSQAGAEAYRDKMRIKLAGTGKQLKLTTKEGLVRVHIGPYASVSEAREGAEEMEEELGFKPMVNLP